MIISRTPFRISFFGGGTDYAQWYRKHGGAVLGTTINKYCYLTCRHLPPFFEHRIKVVYSKVEYGQTVDEINHPTAREVMRFLNITHGVEIHHDADLPARTGMGSSSAFTVGLLHALHALQGHMASKQQLTRESIHIEQDCVQEMVGYQDQTLTAHGGLNHVVFSPNGDISVNPVTIDQRRIQELNTHLLLFFTGIQRTASKIASGYVPDLVNRTAEMSRMGEMVKESLAILNSKDDLLPFGKLLDEAWQIKRSLSSAISTAQVDDLYTQARAAGAVGGKLLGAGGGGFFLVFAPPERHQRIREKLGKLLHVPFGFEFSGSQIIFYDPESHQEQQ